MFDRHHHMHSACSENYGLVLTDRYVVQSSSCEAFITLLTYPVEVRAKVVFLHPLYNFALLAFNPHDLGEEARKALAVAEIRTHPPVRRLVDVLIMFLEYCTEPKWFAQKLIIVLKAASHCAIMFST
jgi:hypothetical protein